MVIVKVNSHPASSLGRKIGQSGVLGGETLPTAGIEVQPFLRPTVIIRVHRAGFGASILCYQGCQCSHTSGWTGCCTMRRQARYASVCKNANCFNNLSRETGVGLVWLLCAEFPCCHRGKAAGT